MRSSIRRRYNFARSILAFAIGNLAVALPAAAASFVDPTATVVNPNSVSIGDEVFVAPFATLRAGRTPFTRVLIGRESNVQDNVLVDASRGLVILGDRTILAHGATVKGPAVIGVGGTCFEFAPTCPSFVGFNSEVEGVVVQKNAMVTHLARVSPGLVVPSGCKVMPGKLIRLQSQLGAAPGCNPPFTTPVTEADRAFMDGVIEVNLCFAEKYPELAAEDPLNVRGINTDPDCHFNPGRQLPSFAGVPLQDPSFRNRVIGDVRFGQGFDAVDDAMGAQIALRADEGAPFEIGGIKLMDSKVVFHALETTRIALGTSLTFGRRALVHGGPANGGATTSGARLNVGKEAVFFQSTAGDDVQIGCRSFVQASQLASGTVIAPRRVVIGNVDVGAVEWGVCN